MRASETKEEKPALRTMTQIIKLILFWKIIPSITVEAWMYKLAKNPPMFRMNMMRVLGSLNVLDIQLPTLLKTTEDRLANSPTKAMSLCVRPVYPRKTPNNPP